MRRLLQLCVCLVPSVSCLSAAGAASAADKVTYDDHVLPLLRAHCGTCHNGADRRGGLVVDDYAGLMQGGASGDAVIAGDSDLSYLYMLASHEDEPKMPPNAPRMSDADLATLKAWIDGGLLQNAGSKAKKAEVNPALAKVVVSTTRPDGPPPMPARYLGDPASVPPRGNTVTGLAVNPWSPLAAAAGHERVTLVDLRGPAPVGTLPFPEGTPQSLKFSQDGRLLMVAGGRGGAEGRVALFDVASGERVTTLGAEYDAAIAADLSPDLQLVAVGTPKKLLRVYAAGDGSVRYESDKHTDWVTAVGFSPDGILLASADRAGGLVIWEAETGREFHVLTGHKAAITALSWRTDSNVLATCGMDGEVKLWEMNDGQEARKFDAKMGGLSDIAYTRDGRIVLSAKNGSVRLFDAAGKQLRDFGRTPDDATRVAYDEEGGRVLAGSWDGVVRIWDAESGTQYADLRTNVPGASGLLSEVEKDLGGWVKRRDSYQTRVNKTQAAIEQRAAAVSAAEASAAEAVATKTAAEAAATSAVAAVTRLTTARQPLDNQAAAAKAAAATAIAARDAARQAADAAKAAVVTATDAAAEAAAAEGAARRRLADAAVAEGEKAVDAAALAKLVDAIDGAAKAAAAARQQQADAAKRHRAAAESLTASQSKLTAAKKAADAAASAVATAGEQLAAAEAAAAKAAEAVSAATARQSETAAALEAAKAVAPPTDEETKAIEDARKQLARAEEVLARLTRQRDRLSEVVAGEI